MFQLILAYNILTCQTGFYKESLSVERHVFSWIWLRSKIRPKNFCVDDVTCAFPGLRVSLVFIIAIIIRTSCRKKMCVYIFVHCTDWFFTWNTSIDWLTQAACAFVSAFPSKIGCGKIRRTPKRLSVRQLETKLFASPYV